MENNSDILKKIHSGEPEIIAEAVKEIKENGDLTIAEALLQNLAQIQDPRLMTIVANLLADIKDTHFCELLIHSIETTTDSDIKTQLLRIVWESSLNYAAYLDVFLHILREDNFSVAFETSTVIENMVHNLTEEQQAKLTVTLAEFPEDKKFLAENILAELAGREV